MAHTYLQAWAHPKNFLDFEFYGLYESPMDTDSMDIQVDPPHRGTSYSEVPVMPR